MKKPQAKKPIDAFTATEMFTQDDSVFGDALDSYMESKGYKWNRVANAYVDDGSLESEWADRVNDERKLINIVGNGRLAQYTTKCGINYNHIERDILAITPDELVTCKRCLAKLKEKSK